jgi:hypothetical protein
MEQRFFQQLYVHLLTVLVTALCLANPTVAAQKKNFSSKLLCDVMKVGCARKISKARVTTKRATRKKTTTASKPKSKSEAISRVVSNQPASPPIIASVPKPQPKPTILPGDSSQAAIAELQHEPPLRKLVEDRNPPAASTYSNYALNCKAELLTLGVDFSVPEQVEGTGECKVADPVQLKSIQTSLGKVELPGRPTLNCAFARQFTIWLSDIAAPATAALAEAKLASLSTGPGYECRGRNGDSSAKISEHAFGNAVDIDGITLSNNKRIEISDVADRQDSDRRMLLALRISACGYFTTVLGPGANEAHASHYHFDLGRHGKSGNYRICE